MMNVMKKIIIAVFLALLIAPTVAQAETVKLVSNTDICNYDQVINADRCKSVYEICDPPEDRAISFQFREPITASLSAKLPDLKTSIKFEDSGPCRLVTIEGIKSPFKDIDNVLCTPLRCYKEWAWWNGSFTLKKPLNFTVSSGTTRPEYQVLINVSHEVGMKDDFGDLRFLNGSQNSEIPYWIKHYEPGSYADVWVQVDQAISTTVYTTYLYFNNSDANTTSNWTAVFEPVSDLYDDDDMDSMWTTSIQNFNNYANETGGIIDIDGVGSANYWKSASWITSTSIGTAAYGWSIEADIYAYQDDTQFDVGLIGLALWHSRTDATSMNIYDGAQTAFQWEGGNIFGNGGNGGPDSDSWTDTLGAYSDGTWIHQQIIWNASDGAMWYYDSYGSSTNNAMSWTTETLNVTLFILARESGRRLVGRFDNLTARKYHSPEPTYTFGDTDVITVVMLLYPPDGHVSANTTPLHYFTVSGNHSTYSCTLYYNSTSVGTNASVSVNTPTAIQVNTSMAFGYYDWNIECVSGEADATSETRTIKIMECTIKPVLRTISEGWWSGISTFRKKEFDYLIDCDW